MGYRGKLAEQQRARELRAEGHTLLEVATELGVSKSSVSLWVRDVEFTPRVKPRRPRSPNSLQRRKGSQIEELRVAGIDAIGHLSERDLLVTGVALYAGEGGKTDGTVAFANADPRMITLFLTWLRRFFEIDETRLRMRLYLHEGLDLEEAMAYWSAITRIPVSQFGKPYRAIPDPSIRKNKHPYGCPRLDYACSRTHRTVMGLTAALLSPARCYDVSVCHPASTAQTCLVPSTSNPRSGVAQLAEQRIVNPKAAGPSPAPGAHQIVSTNFPKSSPSTIRSKALRASAMG